jgi:hypothetical protein
VLSDSPPAVQVRVRCIRPPVGAQVATAIPAAIWVGEILTTRTWLSRPLLTLLSAAAAAATPPIASALLRALYGGSGSLRRRDEGAALERFGRRSVRGAAIVEGRAAIDAGAAGAFVVEPAPGWLSASGAAPWRVRLPARWVISGAAALGILLLEALVYVVLLFGSGGFVVFQFVVGPLELVVIPALLLVTLAGLWPVTRVVGSDRLPAHTSRLSLTSGGSTGYDGTSKESNRWRPAR